VQVLFRKSFVRAHTRRTRDGKVVRVASYHNRVIPAGEPTREDHRTGDLFAQPPAAGQAAPTETPEFKRWFAGSKVVDAQGRPLVLYHGTDADFSKFDPDRIRARFPFSIGYHLTTRPSEASIYASDQLGEKLRPGGNVMPVYARLLNPLVVDAKRLTASMEADLLQGGRRAKGHARVQDQAGRRARLPIALR
jgi:hypothetical protein